MADAVTRFPAAAGSPAIPSSSLRVSRVPWSARRALVVDLVGEVLGEIELRGQHGRPVEVRLDVDVDRPPRPARVHGGSRCPRRSPPASPAGKVPPPPRRRPPVDEGRVVAARCRRARRRPPRGDGGTRGRPPEPSRSGCPAAPGDVARSRSAENGPSVCSGVSRHGARAAKSAASAGAVGADARVVVVVPPPGPARADPPPPSATSSSSAHPSAVRPSAAAPASAAPRREGVACRGRSRHVPESSPDGRTPVAGLRCRGARSSSDPGSTSSSARYSASSSTLSTWTAMPRAM